MPSIQLSLFLCPNRNYTNICVLAPTLRINYIMDNIDSTLKYINELTTYDTIIQPTRTKGNLGFLTGTYINITINPHNILLINSIDLYNHVRVSSLLLYWQLTSFIYDIFIFIFISYVSILQQPRKSVLKRNRNVPPQIL